jgi:replicative DNA helicase
LSECEEVGKADLQIAKHRNGETGGIKLAWIGQYTRFENLALDSMAQYTPDDAMIDAAQWQFKSSACCNSSRE